MTARKTARPRRKRIFILMCDQINYTLSNRYKGLAGYKKFSSQAEAERIAREMSVRHNDRFAVLEVLSISGQVPIVPKTETLPYTKEDI